MKIVSKNLPKFIFMTLFHAQIIFPENIRNIFDYDTNWNHADYDIIAHGHMHETSKAFKVLQCGSESKIVVDK